MQQNILVGRQKLFLSRKLCHSAEANFSTHLSVIALLATNHDQILTIINLWDQNSVPHSQSDRKSRRPKVLHPSQFLSSGAWQLLPSSCQRWRQKYLSTGSLNTSETKCKTPHQDARSAGYYPPAGLSPQQAKPTAVTVKSQNSRWTHTPVNVDAHKRTKTEKNIWALKRLLGHHPLKGMCLQHS